MFYFLLASAYAQTPVFSTQVDSGPLYFTTPHSVAALDLTRDGSQDLFGQTVFSVNYAASIDEDGNHLDGTYFGGMNGIGAPIYPGTNIPSITSSAVHDMDGDGRADVIVVTNSGALMILPNNGSHLLAAGTVFKPSIVVDHFGPQFTANPPFVFLHFHKVIVDDFNSDTIPDILVGGSSINYWGAATTPGNLFLYLGSAAGTYTRYDLPLTGNPINVHWADLDQNGIPDHIAMLVETGSVGAYSYTLEHAAYTPTQGLVSVGNPNYMLGRVTNFEVMNVSGSPSADYLFAFTLTSPISSSVIYYEGDGLGGIGAWNYLSLPSNTTGLDDFLMTSQARDFNGDGIKDYALVRNYIRVPPFASSQPFQYSNADLYFFDGATFGNTVEVTPLNGFLSEPWSADYNMRVIPVISKPELLHVTDLGSDRIPDLFIGILNGAAGAYKHTFLKNSTPRAFGSPGLVKFGDPSGMPTQKARGGIDGEPVLGGTLTPTISNIRGGSIVGLTWGPYAQTTPLFSLYGFDAYIAPTEFFAAQGAIGVAAKDGFASMSVPIPNNPAIVGSAGYFQWVHFDPATNLFGGTQGTEVIIGQ